MTSVMAHRGASAAFAENTLEAFAGARALGADWVELDVRRTADRRLVVHHDAHLPGGVALMARHRAQIPSVVPDLAEALDTCHPLGVNIEIKNGAPDPDFDPTGRLDADALVDLLHRRRGSDQVLVSSFNLASIDRVHELDPTVPTGWLLLDRGKTADLVARAVDGGHAAIHPPADMVDAAFVDHARSAGLNVNVWTVDEPLRMTELVAMGVDGIITNVPDVARRVVDAAAGVDPR